MAQYRAYIEDKESPDKAFGQGSDFKWLWQNTVAADLGVQESNDGSGSDDEDSDEDSEEDSSDSE